MSLRRYGKRGYGFAFLIATLVGSAAVCRHLMLPPDRFRFLANSRRIDALMYEYSLDSHFVGSTAVYACKERSPSVISEATRELESIGFVDNNGGGEVWSKPPATTVYFKLGRWDSKKLECIPDAHSDTVIVVIEQRHQATFLWKALRNYSDLLREARF